MSALALETWACPHCRYFEITDEPDLVAEAREAHLEAHDVPGTSADVDESTDQAGSTDQAVSAVRTANARGNRWRQWSEAEIYDSLKAYAAEIGRTPSSTDWLRATHDRPSSTRSSGFVCRGAPR